MYPIVKSVFNDFKLPKKYKKCKLSLEEHINELNVWLDDKLKNYKGPDPDPISCSHSAYEEDKNGRVFNDDINCLVKFNTSNLMISNDQLKVKSNGSFVTAKANCGVFQGKWQWEVQLLTKGIMQIGWCSESCIFNQDEGVGDTANSYSYDGSRLVSWNKVASPYGKKVWRTGDIIGVCLDMNDGIISYYRNGNFLGDAFTNIPTGKDHTLYPAVSLAFNEELCANFGGAPFRFPIDKFAPLQDIDLDSIYKCECLLVYLVDLSIFISKSNSWKKDVKMSNGTMVKTDAILLIFGSMIINRLSTLLTNNYVIQACVYPFVKSLCVMRCSSGRKTPIHPGTEDSTLGNLLSLLWDHMHYDDNVIFLNNMISYMESLYNEISNSIDYGKQRSIIVVLSCLANHQRTRKYLISKPFFKDNCLANFLYIKPPEEGVLEEIIPDKDIWLPGFNANKGAYLAGCEKIKSYTNALYNLQKNLLLTLLNDDDADDKTLSSRKILTQKFREYVLSNCVEHKMAVMIQGNILTPTPPPIALAFSCILLDALQSVWLKEFSTEITAVNVVHFIDGSFTFRNLDRIGGVISFLRKSHKNLLKERLGEDHFTLTEEYGQRLLQTELNDLYSSLFIISGSLRTGYTISVQNQNSNTETAENCVKTQSYSTEVYNYDLPKVTFLYQLIDSIIILYNLVAHRYVILIAELRDNLTDQSMLLNTENVKLNRETANTSHESILSNQTCFGYGISENSFSRSSLSLLQPNTESKYKRLIKMSRKQAWYRVVSLNYIRKKLLTWLFEWVINTMEQSSVFFAFVPETYINISPQLLDTLLDFSFHDVQDQYYLDDMMITLKQTANLFASYICDNRVVLASCKDSVIQTLGVLACHKIGVKSLESIPEESQIKLMQALLRLYQNRAWGQSNWLLLRFWLGHGFASRETRPAGTWNNGSINKQLGLKRRRTKAAYTGLLHLIAPPCPSKTYLNLIAKLLRLDKNYTLQFLNSVLSQLNWAFSEFVYILQEIQLLLNQKDTQKVSIDAKQIKICSMCFELMVSLLRTLEMIINLLPEMFDNVSSDQHVDNLLNRVCQILIQILTRTTVPISCFQQVLDANLSGLESVTHFAILSVTIGILLALMRDEMGREDLVIKIPKISRILLTDPNFHIACLEFTLGQCGIPTSLQNIPRGNFNPDLGRQHLSETVQDDDEVSLKEEIDSNNLETCKSVSKEICLKNLDNTVKFDFRKYDCHISTEEIDQIVELIEILKSRQALLSEISVFSEESLCPICCARKNNVIFEPCHHQSCENCIIQHLENSKLCFYCKAYIESVLNSNGTQIYKTTEIFPIVQPGSSALNT